MANLKITELNAITLPTADDLFVAVQDPGGTPETVKVTRANLGKGLINPTAKVANYNVTNNDEMILGDASGGTISFNLPAVSGTQGKRYYFKKVDSSANAVIIEPDASETIDGAARYQLTGQYEGIWVESDGSTWWIK